MAIDPSSIPEIPEAVRLEYEATGTGGVFDRALSTIRETIELAEQDRTLLSSVPVVDILTELPYDPDDTVYVVWRADRQTSFWTQARKARYLAHLRTKAGSYGGFVNQTRIMVFNDAEPQTIATQDNVLPSDHIYFSLLPLHRPGTFLASPQTILADYPQVNQLVFGYTLSSRHRYAVIPIPFAEDLEPSALATAQIGSYLEVHRDYDEADGPMRALVTVNPAFIETLLEQTRALIDDERVKAR